MSVPVPSPLEPGYRVGRYELLYALASGGMGQVWVARIQGHDGFEKLFAIKTILNEKASDARFRQMFLDEARIASAIQHPNVAQILDLGEQDGVLFLMMEYVDGDSVHKLHRACQRHGKFVPQAVALRIVSDACVGLHAAHELTDRDGHRLDVVHRDVSPQNILVGVNGIAKVIDFGVAKARGRLGGDSISGSLKGKVRYMSPEQASGKAVDGRADIWGAGAVLYQLLEGEPPYRGDDIDTLRALLSGQAIASLGEHVAPPIAAVVKRALAYNPAERFDTALEMSRAIEHAMSVTGCLCQTAAVASFCAEAVGDRIATRRDTLRVALRAVTQHAEMRTVLREPLERSQSADGEVAPSRRSEAPTVGPAEERRKRAASGHSLASMNASIPGVPRPGRMRRSVVIAAIGATMVAGVASAGLFGMRVSRGVTRALTSAASRPLPGDVPAPPAIADQGPPHTAPATEPLTPSASALVTSPSASPPATAVALHDAPQVARTPATRPQRAPSGAATARPGRPSRQEDDLGSALDTRR